MTEGTEPASDASARPRLSSLDRARGLVMALGCALGPVFERPDRQQNRTLLTLGALFAALRIGNVYGDPSPWTAQARAGFTARSALNMSETRSPFVLQAELSSRPSNASPRNTVRQSTSAKVDPVAWRTARTRRALREGRRAPATWRRANALVACALRAPHGDAITFVLGVPHTFT